jgi:DNA recombination protein RmuC
VSIDFSFLAAILGSLLAGALLGWLASRPSKVRLEAQLEKERALHAERLGASQTAEGALRDAFRALSHEALSSNNQAFLDLAETRLREARTAAAADVEARKKAIEHLLAPMARTLEQVEREVKDSERRRVASSAELLQRVALLDATGRDLREETARLVGALKRPGVRGRWGELQLKRVVELAGMVEHCDFDEQPTLDTNGDRRLRPDVVVHLPGGRHVVVDAKAPLDAYLRALDAPDDASRQALLVDHARQVRAHLAQLASKGYAASIDPSPDFVVMFLPGEMFFSAALEQDPELIEYGVRFDQRVVPASPTTLIALLRAVAYGWQQQAVEENARKISDLGRQLYEAVRVLGGHFESLGARLKSSLDAYNQAVGSLEGNVLVKARKLRDLHAANGGEDLKTLDPIDRVPRLLQAGELTGGLPFPAAEDEAPQAARKAEDAEDAEVESV